MICAGPSTKASTSGLCAPKGRISARSVRAQYKVTFEFPDGETSEVECPPDRYILDVGEEYGLPLPFSCRAGACVSCVGKVESGTVDQTTQTYLNKVQQSEGWVLTCYAYPTSDVIIKTDQEKTGFAEAGYF